MYCLHFLLNPSHQYSYNSIARHQITFSIERSPYINIEIIKIDILRSLRVETLFLGVIQFHGHYNILEIACKILRARHVVKIAICVSLALDVLVLKY